jgi:cell division protein FtsX
MKKTIIALIAGLLLGIILSLCAFKIASLKTAKNYDKQLLEKLKEANITVVLDPDFKDFDSLQTQLENLDNIQSVEFFSRTEFLEMYSNQLSEEELTEYQNNYEASPNYFNIVLDLKSIEDFKNCSNTIERISSLTGVKEPYSELPTFLKIYENYGSKGVLDYNTFMNEY